MTQKESIRLFEERKVRAIWDDEQEEWYFSIVDVISILTDSPNPRKYWSVLKTRLKREGSELTTNCSQLTSLLRRVFNTLQYFLVFGLSVNTAITPIMKKVCRQATHLLNIVPSLSLKSLLWQQAIPPFVVVASRPPLSLSRQNSRSYPQR